MNDDAVSIAPHLHKILFENDRVRVLEITIKPGDTADMHRHPDNVLVVLQGGVLDMTGPDGTTKQLELKEGTALYLESLQHSMVSRNDTTVKMIQVELK